MMGKMLRAAAVVLGSSSLVAGCGTLIGFDKNYQEVPDALAAGGDGGSQPTLDATGSDGGSGDAALAPDTGLNCTPQQQSCTSSAQCCQAPGVTIVCNGRKQCGICSATNCNSSADCCPSASSCHSTGRCDSQPCQGSGLSCAGGTQACCVGLVCFPNSLCQPCIGPRQSPGDAGRSVCCSGQVDDAGCTEP
jgi:hypothetical protein